MKQPARRLNDSCGAPRAPSERLLRDLAEPVAAPDLTRSIMGRLGYMRVPRRVALRRRLRRWSARAVTSVVALLALGVGVRVHQASDAIRRPQVPSIPSALGVEMQHQQERWGGMIRTIRELSTPRPVEERMHETQPSGLPAIQDDVNLTALPIRWV